MQFDEADFLTAVRDRLREIREIAHPRMSDREFARRSGLSHGYIAEIEGRAPVRKLKRDEASSPSITRLARYLYYCKMSLGQFFQEVDPGPDSPRVLARSHEKLHKRLQHVLEVGGDEGERRITDRIDEIEAWIGSQPGKSRASPNPRIGQEAGREAAGSRRIEKDSPSKPKKRPA